MKQEDAFRILRETGALLDGHFELRSKLHSDQYVQCALALQHPRVVEQLSTAVVAKLTAAQGAGFRVDGVIAPAIGGICVGHEVGRALGVRAIFAEKEQGQGRLVLRRGFSVRPGERFVVAEDVVTRGGRVQEVIDIVEARGGKVEAVVVLVDRSGGKAKFSAPTYSLLQWEPTVWEPAACPLCQKGIPLDHPGS